MDRLVRDILRFVNLAFFLCGSTLAAQSANDLREKFGDPVSETFIVQPGITVTATFETHGRITEYIIAPQYTDLIKSRNRTLSSASVRAIIDELIPLSGRGKHLTAGWINVVCLPAGDCQGSSDHYERVTIYYNSAVEGRVHYAVVRLK